MAYRKYKCLETHVNGRYYKKGVVYLFASDPGSRFVHTDEDPRRRASLLGEVDTDGTFRHGGLSGYDDFRFPASSFKLGATLKPDYDYTSMGLAFPQNDPTEVAYASRLTSHKMLSGPGVLWHPHLHYLQDEADAPTFEYRYRILAPGVVVPAWSGWITTVGAEFSYTSGTLHQILVFPPFNAYAEGFTTVASMVDIQLRRNDNLVAGDVVVKEFDIHALFDAPLGSGQEFIK